jgi:hypothetical protein
VKGRTRRASMIRAARTGPMPGSRSSESAGARERNARGSEANDDGGSAGVRGTRRGVTRLTVSGRKTGMESGAMGRTRIIHPLSIPPRQIIPISTAAPTALCTTPPHSETNMISRTVSTPGHIPVCVAS